MITSPLLHAVHFLIQTLFDLAIFNFLARFILQMFKVDHFNPLSQMILKMTNPVLLPLRRKIPAIYHIDTACLVILFSATLLKLTLLFLLTSHTLPHLPGLLLWGLGDLITRCFYFFFFIIMLEIILSWTNPYHPIQKVLLQITWPFTKRLRPLMPQFNGFDFTPLALLILIQLGIILIANPLTNYAIRLI